jgi:SNF2 family DNA or RNA helicase
MSERKQTWDHQPPAIEYMIANKASLLECVMGGGKTFMTIETIRRVVPPGTGKVLVLCPAAVVPVWSGEIRKHANEQFSVVRLWKNLNTQQKIAEIRDAIMKQPAIGKPIVIVVNYESAIRKELAEELQRIWYDIVVCDESHRIKGHGTQSSKLAWKLGKRANKRIALTGTAMPQGPQDIFAQYRFLDENIFGKFWTHFTRRYAVFNKYIPQKIDSWVNQSEMAQKIGLIRYAIGPEVLVLPDRQDIVRTVSLSPAGMRAYREMEKESVAEIKRMIDTENGKVEQIATALGSNGAVSFLRLLQLAQGYVTTDEKEEVDTDTEKRKALLEMLEDIDEPVCVYGWFKHDLRVVQKCCEILGKRYGEVSGARKDLTDAGKYPDNVDVLGVQCKSGGAGIDLTKSRIGILLNSGLMSPGDYDQLMARQHRPGQTRNVIFYHLVTRGTVDVTINTARREKRDVISEIVSKIGSGESLGSLDEADEVF